MRGVFSSKRNFLFDLDGTLIDSTGVHAAAYQEALKPIRPDLAAAFDYAPVAGRPTREIFAELGFHDPELTELTRRKQHLYAAAVERGEVVVFDGVVSLLAQLRGEGRRLFVVTGGNRASVHRVLEATDLKKYFEGITTAEDVRTGKPTPEPFLHTLATHRLKAAESVVIEDAESGVRSALGAGLEVVLVHTTLQLPGVTNAGTFKNLAALLMRRRTCAVVPAAGRGSRLGVDVPKVFVPIFPATTIWDVIHGTLAEVADRIVLVLSPEGREYLGKNGEKIGLEKTEVGVQPAPLGMGDAIFGVADRWREFDDVLIVWGDQFNLSPKTLKACQEIHAALGEPALTIPLVRAPQPYVEYVFDSAGKLTVVRQTREGDRCEANGFSDVGVFLLSGGVRLSEEWGRYLAGNRPGRATGEVNFLPFLAHLSSTAGWPVGRYETDDPAEAIGINTPEDLAFAQGLLRDKFSSLEKAL